MLCLFQPLIKSSRVHWESLTLFLCCRSPSVRRFLLLLLLHIQAPLPLLPLHQPTAATEELAPFQWGSDPAATSITSSPLGNYQACTQSTPAFGFFGGDESHRHGRLCGLVFSACLLLWVTCVCIFHVKEALSLAKHAMRYTHTHMPRCQKRTKNLDGFDQSFCVVVVVFFSPLTSSTLAPGVIYSTVSNSAAACQTTLSVKWRKAGANQCCVVNLTLENMK